MVNQEKMHTQFEKKVTCKMSKMREDKLNLKKAIEFERQQVRKLQETRDTEL